MLYSLGHILSYCLPLMSTLFFIWKFWQVKVFFMSTGLESTVPLSAQFLIAYNPFKVFGIESTFQCSYYQHEWNLFCQKYSIWWLCWAFMKILNSFRNALPITCWFVVPDVGASTNKSIGWRESDIVHRFTCINSLCKSLIINSFSPSSTNYKIK